MEQKAWLGVLGFLFGLCIWLYFYFVVCIVVGGYIGLWVQKHCFAPSKVFFETKVQFPKQWLVQLCNVHKI